MISKVPINRNNFLIEEIPRLNPITQYYERFQWWKEQKRKCIEGDWCSGVWIPGRLYFYINFWSIEIGGRGIDTPLLRDIEWEKSLIVEEARRFSGFEEDHKNTCHEAANSKLSHDQIVDRYCKDPTGEYVIDKLYYNIFTPDGEVKNYIPPQDYLRMVHEGNLGKPVYNNEAKNVIEIGARGFGKSFFSAGAIVGHNFLFDGATDYDDYLKKAQEGRFMNSETMVGAIDAKYSSKALNMFKLGYDRLPGGIEYMGEYYPSPISKHFEGSLAASKGIEAKHDVKVGNNWITKGSRSKLHHRTFRDNPFAAAGMRPSIILLDEVGFMDNLTVSMGPLKDCTEVSMIKFGTIYMTGTGGNMEGGATQEAQEVFYNPEAYDCITFEDHWENRGKIGLFVPVHYTLDQFRDKDGNLNYDEADKKVQEERKEVRKKNKQAYSSELQNRPTQPSEAFLVTGENSFPTAELKQQLGEVEANPKKYRDSNFVGDIYINNDGVVYWQEDRSLSPVREFPIKDNKNKEGAIELFQKPKKDKEGNIVPNRYIAGADIYVDDEAETKSLGSIFIMDLYTERLVAEYTGRPNTSDKFFERCYRLLRYYNATCNYENIDKGMFSYFRNKGALHLLSDTLEVLLETDMVKPQTGNKKKGTHPTAYINKWARHLYREWLMKQAVNYPEGVTNARTLQSEGLIKETIMYNEQGNFDRVSAIGMLMLLKEDRAVFNVSEERERITTKADDSFFTRNYDEKGDVDQKILERFRERYQIGS